MKLEKNEVKISDLLVCLICDSKDVDVVKKSIFVREMDGNILTYTDIDSQEIYNEGDLSVGISKDGKFTLEQGYSYSSVFKKYLNDNNLNKDDFISIDTLKEQVLKMNKKTEEKVLAKEDVLSK